MAVLEHTAKDSYRVLGYFGLSPEEIEKGENPGILSVHKGEGTLELFGGLLTKSLVSGGESTIVGSSMEGAIYGLLEDGTFLEATQYIAKMHQRNIPGFGTSSYEIYDYDLWNIYYSDFECDVDKVIPDSILVRYNNLFNWVRELPETELVLTSVVLDGHSYDLSVIQNSLERQIDLESVQVVSTPLLQIKCTSSFDASNSKRLITTLTEFFTLVTDTVFNPLSIKYVKGRQGARTWISGSKRNENRQFTRNISILLVHHQMKDYLGRVLQGYIDAETDGELAPLKDVLISTLTLNQTLAESEFINYVNAIDVAYHDKKYQGCTKSISSLRKKLGKFINVLPVELLAGMFSTEDEEESFIGSLVGTRNFLVHGAKANSELVLKGPEIIVALEKIHLIVYSYFLLGIGVPEEAIVQHI